MLDGRTANTYRTQFWMTTLDRGSNDIINVAGFNQVNHVRGRLIYIAYRVGCDHVAVEDVCRTGGCVQLEAQFAEAFCYLDNFLLVRITDGNQNLALLLHLIACTHHALEKRLTE